MIAGMIMSAIAVIITITVITLFIIPALYSMLEGYKELKAARKARLEAEEEAFIRSQLSKKK